VVLGAILGVVGLSRILIWQAFWHTYGEHYLLIAFTIAFSLLGVVTFGTLAGSMLPLILRKCGLDPASASAPFVATLVDVTGVVIYFTVISPSPRSFSPARSSNDPAWFGTPPKMAACLVSYDAFTHLMAKYSPWFRGSWPSPPLPPVLPA
jgi:divalent cation transporter